MCFLAVSSSSEAIVDLLTVSIGSVDTTCSSSSVLSTEIRSELEVLVKSTVNTLGVIKH